MLHIESEIVFYTIAMMISSSTEGINNMYIYVNSTTCYEM